MLESRNVFDENTESLGSVSIAWVFPGSMAVVVESRPAWYLEESEVQAGF